MDEEGLASRLLPVAPFPFGERRQDQDKLIFGDTKKPTGFRFETLATEFENEKEHQEDNDSGIDSEDISTISPGSVASLPSPMSLPSPLSSSIISSRPVQTEPMSLVLRDMNRPRDTPRTPKHWKKSISRNYGENRENGGLHHPGSLVTTAQALLSLSRPTPSHNRSLPVPVAPSRPPPFSRPLTQPRIVQPWTTPAPAPALAPALPPTPTSSTRHNLGDRIAISGRQEPTNHQMVKIEPRPVKMEPILPQTPAPLREVDLQQATRPPVSVISWHQPQTSPRNLFPHSIFSENLDEEVVGSSTDKPYHCAECRKSFATQSGFAKHQQLHCSNQIQRDFSCKYCGKGYTSLSALKMHIRTHTLPCKCAECGKSFSRPWLLQGHMRTHTGEKPFGCTHCARSFADKSNLRAHLQTHLQNKKYSCPGCQKTFSRMSLLNKHTDSGCLGLQTRNEECVETLMGLSTGLLRS